MAFWHFCYSSPNSLQCVDHFGNETFRNEYSIPELAAPKPWRRSLIILLGHETQHKIAMGVSVATANCKVMSNFLYATPAMSLSALLSWVSSSRCISLYILICLFKAESFSPQVLYFFFLLCIISLSLLVFASPPYGQSFACLINMLHCSLSRSLVKMVNITWANTSSWAAPVGSPLHSLTLCCLSRFTYPSVWRCPSIS